MDDLVKRLRKKRERFHDLSGVYWSEDMLCQEAADRIEADAARIADLEALVKSLSRLETPADLDALKARVKELEAENERLRRTVDAAWKLGRIVGFLGEDEGLIKAFREECGRELLARLLAALEGEKT